MKTVVHVTHEAVQKIGGIGAVLHGLLTSPTYAKAVKRDILMGPLFNTDGDVHARLNGGEVLYSSIDGVAKAPQANAFARIEREYGVRIVYGRKTFHDKLTGVTSTPEVLLFDVRSYNAEKMGHFKFMLYEHFGIESGKYEHVWDYEQYCRIAAPGLEALEALGVLAGPGGEQPVILSHEYMGMPTALCAMAWHPNKYRTIFYAHEVATMRRLVEDNGGHDTMFYNVMRHAMKQDLYVEDVFGSQAFFYKHPLVQAARFCDNIFAVGDYTAKELLFLHPDFKKVNVDIAYNGVPASRLTLEQKLKSRGKLQQYCENILGYKPDYVFTHVTRLVPSKGLWRDVRVMEQIEPLLRKENKTAVLFVLSTETLGRWPQDILNMESGYQWPVAHREGHPDLTGGEASYYVGVQSFNARSRMGKIVYLNQFGFDRLRCGQQMPADMEFLDIRKGSDAEFGMSIYEPFGIAQVEPISFGGICVFTELCGCAGFVRAAAGGKSTPNAIEVDFTDLSGQNVKSDTIDDLRRIDRVKRNEVEGNISKKIAAELFARLPKNEAELSGFVERGYELGAKMSWDAVASQYVIPGMDKALKAEPKLTMKKKK